MASVAKNKRETHEHTLLVMIQPISAHLENFGLTDTHLEVTPHVATQVLIT